MTREERSFWRLDEAAQGRLNHLLIYEHATSGLCSTKKFAKLMGYPKDYKTLDNQLKGRHKWTPWAVKAAVEFLLTFDRKTTPQQFLTALRNDTFDARHEWESPYGCRPWHSRERDAVNMLKRIAQVEEKASTTLTFGIYPPLWLMPKGMMDRHMDRLLKLQRKSKRKELRAGLLWLENRRYERFQQTAANHIIKRIVVMRYWDFMCLIERRAPLHDHFTSDDINEFLVLLEGFADTRSDLVFEVAQFDDWDDRTEMTFLGTGESTFIGDEMFWFGHAILGPFFWFIERAPGGTWPGILNWKRQQIENLLMACPENPERRTDMKLFFERERKRINSPPEVALTPKEKARLNILDLLGSKD
jgi:hypothetical protein